jgi:hypothetical protein
MSLKTRTFILLVLVLATCGYALWVVTGPYRGGVRCRRRLQEIGKLCLIYAGDCNEVYPDSLSRLVDYGIQPSFLRCPAVKTPGGAAREIDAWSGYKLVPGARTASDRSPIVLYCPPANHGGRYGHIVFSDTRVERVTAEQFEARLAEHGIVHTPKAP